MKKLWIGILTAISLMILFCFGVSACPALSEEFKYGQPCTDGFMGTLYGDEYLNYIVAEDGYIVIQGDNGYWYYAAISSCQVDGVDADQLISSGFRYKLDPVPPLAI